MPDRIKHIIFFVLFFNSLSFSEAQVMKNQLHPSSAFSAEFSTGDKHIYEVRLQKNDFAAFSVMQRGIDIVVSVYDEKNHKLNEYDSPNGKFGPEYFTIHANHKGKYKIEISAPGQQVISGKYDIQTLRIKQKATLPNEKTDELLTRYQSKSSPGIALAIQKDGRTIYEKYTGIANLENKIPISDSTIFHIASVSKQFAVFSILLLEKQKKLSLEDDIRQYLPEMPDYGNKISIKNLANHTSGLREIFDLSSLIGQREGGHMTMDQAYRLLTQQKHLNFHPGTAYEYCNSGFILLAKIVEKVSGKSFSDFTENEIFRPLKMKNSLFLDNEERIIRNKAYSYSYRAGQYQQVPLHFSLVGSTGLNTTVRDLNLWTENFHSATIGDTSLFHKMEQQSTLNNGERLSYALGQEVKQYKGLNLIFHGGGDAGYRSYLVRIPEHNFAMAMTGNFQTFNPLDIAYTIIDYYFDKTPDNPVEPYIAQDTATLTKWAGQYEVMRGLLFTFSAENNKFYLQINGSAQKLPLPALSDKEFMFPALPHSRFVFSTDENGTPDFRWHLSDFSYKGKKINSKVLKNQDTDLALYTGRFYSPELETEYEFSVMNGKLMALHLLNGNIPMNPMPIPDTFNTEEGYFRKVEFVRDQHSRIVGCKVSATGVREVLFEKTTSQ